MRTFYLLVLLHSRLELNNSPTASLQRGNPSNECPEYDTKQSDGEVPVILELLGVRSTSLLPSLSGPLWAGVILFTNPSAPAGYDTRSIFKRSLTGLNSEFSFS